MDYFGDKHTDIGQAGMYSARNTFPSIDDTPIEVAEPQRHFKKDEIVQEDVVEGFNRAIKSKDKDGETRLLLGFKEDAF